MLYEDLVPDVLSSLPPLSGAKQYRAVAKIRLVHRQGISVMIPELVFALSGNRFIEPSNFGPCWLGFFEDDGFLTVPFRVGSTGQFLFRTTISQHVCALADGSHLYRGELAGPKPLTSFLKGNARWIPDRESFDVRLYHHTTPEAREAIVQSCHLRGSPWNYQGTRKLANVSYAYLTSRRVIRSDEDLNAIGMAAQGKVALRCDDGPAGFGRPVLFDVYREQAKNRRSTISLWTPIEALAPSHIIAHAPPNDAVWYEIASPEIYRIPLLPDSTAALDGDTIKPCVKALRTIDYAVIADATDPDKIGACLDEEGTDAVFKFERVEATDLISFWKQNQNSDLYSGKVVDAVHFTDEDNN